LDLQLPVQSVTITTKVVLDKVLCDKVCQRLATFRWFSQDAPVSSTNKTDRHDITEIKLKVALNIKNQNPECVHGKLLPI